LFGTPSKGPIYIQMGAVEKGTATLLTHGLRKLGYGAFITQGTSDKIFRVLVGPFKDAAEYEAARSAFQQLGLDNFSRRYEK
jgi:cell division septation protein DedD